MLRLPTLYAILDIEALTSRGLAPVDVFDAWLDAGIRLIQLRTKSMAGGPMLALASDLADRARSAGAAFIVNDRADIAAMAGADGVHVGQGDLTPSQAQSVFSSRRALAVRNRAAPGTSSREAPLGSSSRGAPLGSSSRGALAPRNLRNLMIGLSTHTIAQLTAGLAEPADYLAFGPVFPTASKANPDPAVGVAMVRAAAGIVTDRPLVAIGGITLATAPAVLAAGASSVAVISDLLGGDIGGRAREYVNGLR